MENENINSISFSNLKEAMDDSILNKNEYLTILDSLEDMVAVIRNRKIIFCNSSMFEFFGESENNLEKINSRFELFEDILDFLEKNNILGVNGTYTFKKQIENHAGEIKTLAVKIKSISGDSKPFTILTAKDITPLQEAMQTIDNTRGMIPDLECLVENFNKELDSFIYTVSHDLKAPILSIEGMVELLLTRRNEIPSDMHNIMERMKYNANKLNNMLKGLLELSRVGRFYTDAKKIKILTVARQTASCIEGRTDKGLIKTNFNGEDVEIEYSLRRLSQVFNNLLENAYKAVQNEPIPLVEVTSEVRDNNILITVRDNGVGIEEKFHHEIFKPFRKLQPFMDKPGIGLGLPIAKKIVKTNKGEMWLESHPGCGAAFCFTIPLQDDR